MKKVEEEEQQQKVVKKMLSLPVRAKRQCVIRYNTSHAKISAPHSKYHPLKLSSMSEVSLDVKFIDDDQRVIWDYLLKLSAC